jgi:hypothetical protein
MSYTDELTQIIIEEYMAEPTRATVDRLAEEHNKTARSIISKLSSAKIYRAPVRTTKTGDEITRKVDLAKEIGEWFGLEVPSLAKASKIELLQLHKALSDPLSVRAHLVDLQADG